MSSLRGTYSWLSACLWLWAAGSQVGCSSDSACTGADCAATSFESDLPSASSSAHGTSTSKDASNGLAGGTVSTAAPAVGQAASSGNDAARAISEADIIQLQGDRLYALSRVAGLSVIDVSQPDALRLLGRYRELPAQPFELYVRADTALVMFTGWGQYAKNDAGDYTWVSTSKLLALDVSDPANITSLSSFDVPGSISDSRIVGDVLYIVGHQDGYCWGCTLDKPQTSIVSLDVSDPHAVKKVDELDYDDAASWGALSVTVTDQRMYVAGPEYGAKNNQTGSTIQVVDISDPHGAMTAGAMVSAQGQISSRWQIDEWNGVLRVISQAVPNWLPDGTHTDNAPSVQTFRVASAQNITPLGQTDLSLPPNETLRSARFDGPRAYAITAEQKDPLFTIDLSDPAKPRQVGQLVMPGFVYYMEPRGERVLGLGFDQGNPAGSIAVSLFDVKDLAAPKLLSRVNFGGSWGSLPEDQDRIQKVFRVLDDAGVILVPFSGWNNVDFDKASGCGSSYAGGVEIIDFKNDTLTGRGATPSEGEMRRALLSHDRLLTVSDERVQAFDITDRDAPKQVSEVVLARYVYRALQLDGGVVARLSQDGQTARSHVDFVASEDAGDANQSFGELDLSAVGAGSQCAKSLSIEASIVHGTELDLLYSSYEVDGGNPTRGLLVVDASDPKQPRLVSDTHWDNTDQWYQYGDFYSYGVYAANDSMLRTEHTLSMLESSWTYDNNVSIEHVRLRVFDLRKPDAVVATFLPLPDNYKYAGLIADGEVLLSSHFIGSDATRGRSRFFVDRFDVSDPSAPKLLGSVNVPGTLLQYDRASGRALTSEQKRVPAGQLTAQQCYDRFAYADYDWAGTIANAPVATHGATGTAGIGAATPVQTDPVLERLATCTGYQQELHLVALGTTSARLEDSLLLDEDQQLSAASLGDGMLFATLGHGSYYGAAIAVDCFGPCGAPQATKPTQLLVLSGFDKGKFVVGRIDVEHSADAWWGFWGSPPVYAYGNHALLVGQSDVALIDASTPNAPKLSRQLPLVAATQYVDVRGDTALFTLGAQGVQWLSLE